MYNFFWGGLIFQEHLSREFAHLTSFDRSRARRLWRLRPVAFPWRPLLVGCVGRSGSDSCVAFQRRGGREENPGDQSGKPVLFQTVIMPRSRVYGQDERNLDFLLLPFPA